MNKSSLMKLDFDVLYKLYDQSTDPKEKELIKQIVNEKSFVSDETDFMAYPGSYTPNFQEQIYQKQEFNANQLFLDTTGITNDCNAEFSIKPHQSFLKNFVTKESPYKSVLIYHGVGVGKTCSGITIAENFRDQYARKDKRILILSSKNIQIGWKKTIYTPEKKSNQCTGDSFTSTSVSKPREVNKLIKQYYELMAYQSFSNFVNRMIHSYKQRNSSLSYEECKKRCLSEYFSDRLLIIDEVHNIRDEQGNQMRDTVKSIEDVIRYSNDMRLILLTATPMYNRSTEIIWILNMMLLNDKRPLLSKQDYFTKQGDFIESKQKDLESKCRGYISYLRGENPINFPIRLHPSQLIKQSNPVFLNYPKHNPCSIITPKHCPEKNIVGGAIKDKFQFLELFGSKLEKRELQELVYTKSIQNLIKNNPTLNLNDRGDKNSILDNISLTQIANIVFPIHTDNLYEKIGTGEITIDELYGEKGLRNSFHKRGTKYSYKDNIPPIFDKENIQNYSAKLSSIIHLIDNSEGIIFIYTNYIQSGILPLQFLLEQNGYKRHGTEGVLRYPEWSKTAKIGSTKREPMSYDGLTKTEAGDEFKQAKYMVIDGSTNKKLLEDQLKIINSQENKDGQLIKIVLGTVVASEGLDFKRIRSVHIVDPWLHLNRIEQIIGRAIRFCSHADMSEKDRNVLIYLHALTLTDKKESIDSSIYRYAERKSIEIGKIETILKSSAVDRYLYKDLNVIHKNDISHAILSPSFRSKDIRVNLYDKPYSKICSWSNECDYNQSLVIKEDPVLNSDTMFDQYSQSCIDNLVKKISLLYKEFYVFDIHSIVGLLQEYGFNQTYMIYKALYTMITNQTIIYDKYGNSGIILNYGIYYIFQPSLLDDTTIPMYYRMNIHPKGIRRITLPRVNEVIDICECHKTYTIESMKDVYEDINNYKSVELNECISELRNIYSDIHKTHKVVLGYIFDRLSFNDKCKLLYGYMMNIVFDYEFYEDIQSLLSELILYKQGSNYYLTPPSSIKDDKFGFILSYNNKPCFFEFYNNEFIKCNELQITTIKQSLIKYKQSSDYKKFITTSPIWGYIIIRNKGYKKEYAMKLVESSKDKQTKYPPGPGNVCIENNLATRIDNLLKLMDTYLPEFKDIYEKVNMKNKRSISILLELIFRYKETYFYRYDKIWLKYF